MSNKVKYDNKVLSLLKNLSEINKKITIEKSEDGNSIMIHSRNPSNSVAYNFKAPINTFNFEGDTISFFAYNEFYQLFSVHDEPSIHQTVNTLEIKKDRAKLKYFLAEKDALKIEEEHDYIKFRNSKASFILSSEKLKKFKTMVNLIKGEDLKFTVKDNKLLINLFYEENHPSYEEEFDLEESVSDDFTLNVTADIIKFIPENDYKIDLNPDGIIKFGYINDNKIELDLFVSQYEDDNND